MSVRDEKPRGNWILQHPMYQLMKSLEVEDSEQVHAAFLVYMDLKEASVRCVDRGFPVLLCAVASDSTLVYQRMTDGLVTPDPPAGPFQDVGRRQHRKRKQLG
ncbi:unnamed protein product [Tetraodon nigroviridis]|uniref:(spotted green pufferfish) hypothetical protein n=1 Tax=Tetraodon nigroviridis TaxID=99883 RepID=Q4SP69_TETNG|nr:unnamed protein product [Tetraodon nigroviridis]